MEVWALGLDARCNEARCRAEKCRADLVAMRRRCNALTAERNLLRGKTGRRVAHPADESVMKKLRGLLKEFVPYAIERDYCRRRYGLVNRWDARKTKGMLKKAARFCFELLPYGFVYRFSAKRYRGHPRKANRRRKPVPAQNPLGTVWDGRVPFDPEKPNIG